MAKEPQSPRHTHQKTYELGRNEQARSKRAVIAEPEYPRTEETRETAETKEAKNLTRSNRGGGGAVW